jgi:nitrogen fixation protein NifU and related proteins
MDMYGEIILDHFKNPRQSVLLESAHLSCEDSNPLCGDKVKVTLQVNDANEITKFGFQGEGCAVSIASTSLLGEKLIGLNVDDLLLMDNGQVLELLEIPISPGRVKCALLGFSCLKKAAKIREAELKNNQKDA